MLRFLSGVIIITFLILFSWRNLIININTHLPNWYDELFIIWVYQNNVKHFSTLDFNNLYETNAIYPFKHTLSFAEQMFFPSFLIFLINFIDKNPIFQFNFLTILNQLLIFLSSLIFFMKLTKNKSATLVASFYLTFSPYFFRKMDHYQMVFFWPTILSLYFFASYLENKNSRKNIFFSGILTGLQFLSSVYLGIMNITIIFLWGFTELLSNWKSYKNLIKTLSLYLLIFALISAISLYGYYLVDKEYQVKRDYREYVTYSAHLTDYIFPAERQQSLIYSSPFFKRLQSLNHHSIGESADFVGIIPLFFGLLLLLPRFKIKKDTFSLDFNFSKVSLFSLLLILVGFTFSLGPRLFVNGAYTEIPLPYDLFLKIFSPIGIIRALARWHFLVILGFSILLGLSYAKIDERFKTNSLKRSLIFIVSFTLLLAEFYSLTPFNANTRNWSDESYSFLSQNICKNSNTTLLEYPFHYRALDGDITKDVNYMATILFNSTSINCKILSGYYGYEPPRYLDIKKEFENGFTPSDVKLIKSLNINYLKFNKFAISNQELQNIYQSKIFDSFNKVYENPKTIIFKVS